MTTAAWAGLALLAVLVLVALAYFLGRLIWRVAEPWDDDPGGRAVSMADVYRSWFSGTPFVDYLRIYKRGRDRNRKPSSAARD